MKRGSILLILVFLSGCGLLRYPGHPGVKTDGYAKVDVEFATEEGLYVYEVRYDNGPKGKGVSEIISLCYPNAKTFTSNVRTNLDGAVFRAKRQYKGAQTEMIVRPLDKEILMPPDSRVSILLEADLSVDEVDDRNLNEEALFAKRAVLSNNAFHLAKFRWDLLKAGRLARNGLLYFEVTKFVFEDKTFEPRQPIQVQTNLAQNGIRLSLPTVIKNDIHNFIEFNYIKGFQGNVKVELKGMSEAITLPLKIHTPTTAERVGYKLKKMSRSELAALRKGR